MKIRLESSVNHQIATLAVLLKRQVFRVIAKNDLDITPDQWVILYFLWQKDGLSVGELAAKAKKDFANVTRIVSKLEVLGYVARTQSEKDSRVSHIYLQPKADQIKDKVQQCMVESTDIAMKGISQAEQERLLTILDRIECNILENETAVK